MLAIVTEKGKERPMSGDLKRRLLVDAGRRIREARTEQALSLEQLARLTGISAPALSLIETGKRDPRLTTLVRIAAALRVPLEALVADKSTDVPDNTRGFTEGYDLGDYQ